MQIKIRYTDPMCEIQALNTASRNWIDLCTSKSVSYEKGDIIKIPLGVAMELPKGYEAYVLPRSSTPLKYGLIIPNGMGIIDETYNGNDDVWHFIAYAVRDGFVPCYARIAQFRIVKRMGRVSFKTVERLNNKNRGGFGSTGN